jgi:ribosomal protein S18 acetylase RimI-like enzyme
MESVTMPRIAALEEAADLARIINDAFIVEAFFKIGDRTGTDEIAALMNDGGEFLVIDAEPTTENEHPSAQNREPGTVLGCVYLKVTGDRAYFGMLSIAPSRQRQGLGRQLIDAVEARARQRGCRFMDIHIVNLREELPGYYRRLGYIENGTLPFSAPDRASRPCFFIVMSKPL